MKEEPVVQIAQEFQITRQRVYPLITLFKEKEEYPELKSAGRRPRPIDPETEGIILESYRANNLGPTHLEKKIEETYGIHIPHNRIYQVLLSHGLVDRDQHEETKIAEMGPVRTGSFHVDVVGGLEGIRNSRIQKMGYRVH